MPDGTLLVISAHAADFVWRAGGAIALYGMRGWRVRVVCLSFGERGESAELWKRPGMTLDGVKAIRREECQQAARILGAEIRFLDAGDYPLRATDDLIDGLVTEFRSCRPDIVLTHALSDPYNTDHPEAGQATLRARIYAQAPGYPGGSPIGAPPVFLFEPHQPEQCDFKPDVLLDITPAFDRKRAAMESMAAQRHLWEYYSDLARRRGAQARRNSNQSAITYAEAYERVYPHVTGELQ